MRPLLREGLGYALVSACALLTDVALLALLVRYGGWNYLAAATTSFLAGACIAYVLSVRFVFTQHRLRNRPRSNSQGSSRSARSGSASIPP